MWHRIACYYYDQPVFTCPRGHPRTEQYTGGESSRHRLGPRGSPSHWLGSRQCVLLLESPDNDSVPCILTHSRIHAFTHSLTRTRQDETVLFDPVAAAPDALNVVYAYPNEYTVGITSLGYQLVWAYLETSELTSVSRRCGYCNSIARRSLDAHSTLTRRSFAARQSPTWPTRRQSGSACTCLDSPSRGSWTTRILCRCWRIWGSP